MTKREAERWANVVRVLSGEGYGISREDIESLRRIEMTLRRWSERECNGEVEVDDDGKAYKLESEAGFCAYMEANIGQRRERYRYRIPNREAAALRRLAAIMARYPHLRAYHQTDPRGRALYVYQLDKMGDRAPDCCYSSVGVAVCR